MVTRLDLAPRLRVDSSMPFWHRSSPVLSGFRPDPGFVALRSAFPDSWRELVAVKRLLDGNAVLGADPDPDLATEGAARLPTQVAGWAAEHLSAVAAAEERRGRDRTAACARTGAGVLAGFARTGGYGEFTVPPPAPDQPWLYCGPLASWGPRAVRHPASLVVTSPNQEYQSAIDLVDERPDVVRRTVGAALAGPVKAVTAKPAMTSVDLVLAGGESAFGHKNFAHFFPLETPGGRVDGVPFTVLFTNVHRERLRRCSLPTLRRVTGDPGVPVPLEQVLRASLTWFRCHDLGHFWRRADDTGRARPGRSPYEGMALEETYADLLGLLCALRLVDPDALAVAFGAELLRYLSRGQADFADSVAATLEAGWFRDRGLPVPPVTGTDLAAYLPAAEALVRVLAGTLWGDEPDTGAPEALAAGREFVELLRPIHEAVPTDLTYVFG